MMRLFSFGRKSSDADLAEYRARYPNRPDNPRLNLNVQFYCNEVPMQPDRVLIDVFHQRVWGRYDALEMGHSYIQYLFPIQEQGLNHEAQPLQKHEIDIMKRDPRILRRLLLSLQLMMDFYGFEVIVQRPPARRGVRSSGESADIKAPYSTSTIVSSSSSAASATAAAPPPAPSKAVQQQAQLEQREHERQQLRRVDDRRSTYQSEFGRADAPPAPAAGSAATTNVWRDGSGRPPQQYPLESVAEGEREQHNRSGNSSTSNNDDKKVEEGKNDDDVDKDEFPYLQLKDARIVVQRHREENQWKSRFRNLLSHSHNNLRITRILKCLGEMDLENVKLAVLDGLRVQIFGTGVLGSLRDSYLNFWIGTVYDDELRESMLARCNNTVARR